MIKPPETLSPSLAIQDLLGYFGPGSLVLFGTRGLLDHDSTISSGDTVVDVALLIVAAYVAGQLLVWVSRWVVASPLKLILGNPDRYLVDMTKRRLKLPEDDFPPNVKRRIINTFENHDLTKDFEATQDYSHLARMVGFAFASTSQQQRISRYESLMFLYRGLVIALPLAIAVVPIEVWLRATSAAVTFLICLRGYWWYYALFAKYRYYAAWIVLWERSDNPDEA